jgi:hypothetical protein
VANHSGNARPLIWSDCFSDIFAKISRADITRAEAALARAARQLQIKLAQQCPSEAT